MRGEVVAAEDDRAAGLGPRRGGHDAAERRGTRERTDQRAEGSAARHARELYDHMGVVYFDGPAAIAAGMAQIRTGAYSPAIVWIAGDEGANDLGSDGPCCDTNASTTFEGEAVNFNTGVINGFVDQGGGLLSHGTCYLWLLGFRPGLGMSTSAASATSTSLRSARRPRRGCRTPRSTPAAGTATSAATSAACRRSCAPAPSTTSTARTRP